MGIVSLNENFFMKHLLHELHTIHANMAAMNGTGFQILDCLQW